MRRKILILFTMLLVSSGPIFASNMGFKLNKALTTDGSYQLNWVSLPYFTSLTTASQVCADIGPNAAIVSRWVTTPSEGYEDYFCEDALGVDFAVSAGTAILVKVTAPTNWIIVGSHNDTASVNFNTNGSYQLNWFSVPYHKTATTASELCTQIGLNAAVISRWVSTPSEGYQDYFCEDQLGDDFTLTPGEGIIIKVSAPTSYQPSHY